MTDYQSSFHNRPSQGTQLRITDGRKYDVLMTVMTTWIAVHCNPHSTTGQRGHFGHVCKSQSLKTQQTSWKHHTSIQFFFRRDPLSAGLWSPLRISQHTFQPRVQLDEDTRGVLHMMNAANHEQQGAQLMLVSRS